MERSPITPYADPAPGSYRRWAIFWIGSLNFVVSMFYRVSTAVISPALIRDLDFTSAQLSDLSAVFFYSFALSQLPIGVAMDRLGPRKTMSILALIGIAGASLFAIGRTPNELIISRALLGIGMGGNLMVPLALLAVWFPVNRFAFLTGSVVSIGSLGNLFAATPLAMMSLSLGWRETFVIFAAINAIGVASFLLVARDRPDGSTFLTETSGSLTAGLRHIFGMYSYWAISMASFVRYGYMAALQGLWAVPFLVYGLGLGEIDASNAILCLAIGQIICLPVSGWASDKVFRSRKKVVLAHMILSAMLILSFAWWTLSVPFWWIFVSFFALGFILAPGNVVYSHIKELVSPSIISQAMTALNLFTILGAGLLTHVLGLVIGAEPSVLADPADFRGIWYVGAIAFSVVILPYMRVPDSQALRPKEPAK